MGRGASVRAANPRTLVPTHSSPYFGIKDNEPTQKGFSPCRPAPAHPGPADIPHFGGTTPLTGGGPLTGDRGARGGGDWRPATRRTLVDRGRRGSHVHQPLALRRQLGIDAGPPAA